MISPRKSKRWNWVITPHPTATSSPVHLSLCPYLSSSLQFLWATVLWSLSLSVSQGLPWLSSSFSSIINSSLSMESKHASISTPFMKISLGSALPFSHGSIPPLSSEQHSLQELSVLALSSFTSVLFIPSYVAFLSTPPLKWHLARPLIANKYQTQWSYISTCLPLRSIWPKQLPFHSWDTSSWLPSYHSPDFPSSLLTALSSLLNFRSWTALG